MQYTVKPGDSLSIIARDVLNDINLWPAIAKLNSIANPNIIMPGMVLTLPDVGGATNAKDSMSKEGFIYAGLALLLAAGGYLIYKNKKKGPKPH